MKKSVFFSVFLMFFSFAIMFTPTTTHADMENYTCNITASSSAEKTFSFDEGTVLNINYSDILDNEKIIIKAEVTPSSNEAPAIVPSFEWKLGGKVLSTANTLTLNKTISSFEQNLLLVETSKYVLTITDESTKEQLVKVVTVKVNYENTECNLITLCDFDTFKNMSRDTQPFNIGAVLPVNTNYSVSWLVKTPNSTKYVSTSDQATLLINPADIINDQNGYGTYKFIAVAQKGSATFYSKTIEINAVPAISTEEAPSLEGYSINQNIVDNTKTNIEATKFSINNSQNLDESKIIWYVGKIRVANGKTFIYEPTTKDSYTVTAKYLLSETNTVTLDSAIVSPNATGTWLLFVYIGAAVVILSTILTISIIRTNKKRDVVW